jgi:hypothetical protein
VAVRADEHRFALFGTVPSGRTIVRPGGVVRLLHFADLHLDTPFRWAPREVARARRRGLRETLLRICELAGEQRVDALTCGR